MSRVGQVWRKSPGEIAWRAAQAARIHRDRLHARLRRPAWNREELPGVLAPAVIDPPLRASFSRRDWEDAHRLLLRALRARPRPFVLDPASAPAIRQQVLGRWPDAASHASERADRIVRGGYDCLGYHGLSYARGEAAVDWHLDPVHQLRAPLVFWADVPYLDSARVGDHKITWEINRHQHWLALGRALWLTRDTRYAAEIVSQLEDWMGANPPLTGINWRSALELGFRSLSWLWAMHFLMAGIGEEAAPASERPWLLDLLLGLDRQMRHLEQNLSYYFSPNTHLTGEALALYATGLSVPELAGSARWKATGRRILLTELTRQVAADGGHAERSFHYHRYTLDFYVMALLLARRSQDVEAIAPFTGAVTRLAEFARAIADSNGRMPLVGDDDGGMLWPIAGRSCADLRDSLALAAVVLGRPDLAPWGVPEEVFWIAGREAAEQAPHVETRSREAAAPLSASFVETGYVVARDGAGGHLVFDVGAHGYMNGGHAHADALSVTLAVNGRPLLVDPGTATYSDAAWRDRMRSTANHNTLTLDGRPSSVPDGPFHWRSKADATLGVARHNPAFDWAEASHDGFEGHRHRRTIVRAPAGGWLILDEVLGTGSHTADLHWHFDPSWTVSRENATHLRAVHADGGTVWIAHDGNDSALHHGDESTGLGWFAPVYGMRIPTWSARVSRPGPAPLSVATWIAQTASAPSLVRLAADCDAGGIAYAIRVRDGDTVWTTVLRPGEPAARDARGCTAAAYHMNGRLLHYGSRGGQVVSLAACDASHVLALREGWLSVVADEPLSDIHIEVAGETIDVWSSALTSCVRIQGALVASARGVRVNGRPLERDARERADSIAVPPSHGGEPGRKTPCVALQVSQT